MRHTIQGEVTTAVIHGAYPDAKEAGQIYGMLRSPAFKDAKVCIMPDHHPGKGCLVGLTMQIPADRKVIPAIIGTDIGCGVMSIRLDGVNAEAIKAQLPRFDKYLRDKVPGSFGELDRPSRRREWLYGWYHGTQGLCGNWDKFEDSVRLLCNKTSADLSKVWKQCGTLGGGNHFIELGQDSTGTLWLSVHSGSRGLGLKVCTAHQRFATKESGRQNGLEWLSGTGAEQYLADMRIAQRYAVLNRLVMLDTLLGFFDLKIKDLRIISSVHNYIDDHDMVRKGAVSAHTDQEVLIPLTMADGIVIGTGLGNEDWNLSAPHGAGRKMSRSDAKQAIPMAEYRDRMKDVWSSCVSVGTVDESPGAYKDPDEILAVTAESVTIVDKIIPIYNFKAGGEHLG